MTALLAIAAGYLWLVNARDKTPWLIKSSARAHGALHALTNYFHARGSSVIVVMLDRGDEVSLWQEPEAIDIFPDVEQLLLTGTSLSDN